MEKWMPGDRSNVFHILHTANKVHTLKILAMKVLLMVAAKIQVIETHCERVHNAITQRGRIKPKRNIGEHTRGVWL